MYSLAAFSLLTTKSCQTRTGPHTYSELWQNSSPEESRVGGSGSAPMHSMRLGPHSKPYRRCWR